MLAGIRVNPDRGSGASSVSVAPAWAGRDGQLDRVERGVRLPYFVPTATPASAAGQAL
jgi:hypothetical protein